MLLIARKAKRWNHVDVDVDVITVHWERNELGGIFERQE